MFSPNFSIDSTNFPNSKIYVQIQIQITLGCQGNYKKKKCGQLLPADLKNYSILDGKVNKGVAYKSVEQDRKSRNKSTHVWSTKLWKAVKAIQWGRESLSRKDTGTIGHLDREKMNLTPYLHHTKKLIQSGSQT